VSRALRWVVISIVGVGVFAVTWWLTEAVIGVDRGTAQALAGLAVALVTLPAGWWFALDPSAHGQGPAASEGGHRGRRRGLLPALVAALVILVVGGAVLLRRGPTHGSDGAGYGPRSGASTAAAGDKQRADVNKTVWYAGLKVTIGTVTFDAARRPQLIAGVRLENEATANFDPYYFDVSYKSGTQFIAGHITESNPVPALTTSDYQLGFDVDADQLGGALTAGSFVLGKGDEAQAVVPIGPGELVANAPRTVLNPGKVTIHDLVLTFTGCELRADFVQTQRQTSKGQYVLGCRFDLQYTARNSLRWFRVQNMRLRLPDNTSISAEVPPDELLTDNRVIPGVYAGFTFAWPMPGSYVLQIVDPQGNETPSPANTRDLPFTV
jgi:hypothetical protein